MYFHVYSHAHTWEKRTEWRIHISQKVELGFFLFICILYFCHYEYCFKKIILKEETY